MTSQLLIIIIVLALLLLMGGALMLLAVGVFFFMRTSSPPDQLPSTVDTARVQHRLRTGTTEPPPPRVESVLPEPMSPFGAPIGAPDPYMDVEDDEGAKTEVFQRGSLPMEWDEDEEGEATEIFRADVHGPIGDDYKMDG